eukprot:SAG25_NODE_5694_length_630_cov_0.824859_2_plen_167_part_01
MSSTHLLHHQMLNDMVFYRCVPLRLVAPHRYLCGGQEKGISALGTKIIERKSAPTTEELAVDMEQVADECWQEIEHAAAQPGAAVLGNPHDQFAVAGLYYALRPALDSATSEQPPGLSVELREYQKRALAWMLEREKPGKSPSAVRGGILAEEMGLGAVTFADWTRL